MKKLICMMLACWMAVSLAACGGGDGELLLPDSSGDVGGSQNAQQATVAPAVILEQKDLKIQVKELDTDSLFGTELKLLIENNSDKNLTVQCRNVSVNGYMVETMFSADVAAGKKANDAITFLSADLERSGITQIADLEFSFHVFTTEDWDAYLDSEQIQVKTSLADTFSYTYDHTGTPVYEGDDIKVIAKGLSEKDSILGPELQVYIYNGGSKSVTVQTRETSINGFMVETLFSQEVLPGKHAVAGITFLNSDLEENDIEKIEQLEFSFHIFNTETWKTIKDTDPVKLSFQ